MFDGSQGGGEDMSTADPIPLNAIREAQARLAGTVVPTPLIPLNADIPAVEVFLKLENLQPIGSFKLRGAANAIKLAGRELLEKGIWTASTGNMAQGVAWCARQMGVGCTVVVYEGASETKVEAIERLGANVVRVPYEDWLQIFRSRSHDGMQGLFIHPFDDPAVMAGNGTIGLEILSAWSRIRPAGSQTGYPDLCLRGRNGRATVRLALGR
jgi:threonine dehydratase